MIRKLTENTIHFKPLLLDQAKLLEGIPLDDKMFCDKLNDLILESIK